MDLDELADKFKSLNIFEILNEAFDTKSVKEYIITLNQEQLSEKGIDANGKVIRTYKAPSGNVYSINTIVKKYIKGQRTDIVTLKDTGSFYKTFDVIVDAEGIEIVADFSKPDGSISDNLDTDNVLGLTEESQARLIEAFLRTTFNEMILKKIIG